MVYALVNCSPGPWVPGDGRDLHPSWLGILAFFLTGWVGNIPEFVGGNSLILPGWVGNIPGFPFVGGNSLILPGWVGNIPGFVGGNAL